MYERGYRTNVKPDKDELSFEERATGIDARTVSPWYTFAG
jgi:hypothetical protein